MRSPEGRCRIHGWRRLAGSFLGDRGREKITCRTGKAKLADRKTRVLLADDHAMFRQGIREMLSTDSGIEVVGEAKNGREAVTLVQQLRPDVVLLDVEMPVMGAREAMERMLESSPLPRVVIVTMHDDPRLVRELIGLGAVAYLVKSATMEELHAAVHTAANSPIGPGEDVVVVATPKALRDRAEADGLSERELEVLLMVARGMSNQQIASSLHLSEATIKRHLANIYPRIGVSSRGEAVWRALSERWISARDITDGETREGLGSPPAPGRRPTPMCTLAHEPGKMPL
jgi:DNA-binding NarL/FixJ family response regulator